MLRYSVIIIQYKNIVLDGQAVTRTTRGSLPKIFKHCKQTEETLSLNSPSGRPRLSQESCAKLLPHILCPDDRRSPWQGDWARKANGLLWKIHRGGLHPAHGSSAGAKPVPGAAALGPAGPGGLPMLAGLPSFHVGSCSLPNRPLTCSWQLLSRFKAA